MGLGSGPRSDPYAAYCFDEAVWIFGSYVEREVEKSQKGAKTTAESENRARSTMTRIFAQDTPIQSEGPKELEAAMPPPGTFKDPAEFFK